AHEDSRSDASEDQDLPGQSITWPIAHLSQNEWYAGRLDLRIDGEAAVDTDLLTLTTASRPALVLRATKPSAARPNIPLLGLRSLDIGPAAHVRVVGSLPLAVIVETSITIEGVIDVGAHGAEPGAAGQGSGRGLGAGFGGGSENDYHAGGGGAGFRTRGGW